MINEKDYTYKISAAGRVNLIGEHVDYCGGKVFPAALSLRNTVYVRPNGTDKINLSWTTIPDKVSLDINRLESYKNLKFGNYQAGSILTWKNAGRKIIGCDMLHDCSVPFGSGLSSSAAIEVSTIAAIAVLAGEELNLVEIALAAQRAEREFVGVNCGIMDQYASACGKSNQAMLLDCKTLDCEYVPLDLKDCSLVIIDCKKPHNLIESKYNERRAETDLALSKLQEHVKINCLADLTEEQFALYGGCLNQTLYKRVKHVVDECKRVSLAADALKSGDLVAFGKLLNQSHQSLDKLYDVAGKELNALAAAAQSHSACLGSRMTGGGFGGCTVSVVKTDRVEHFKNYVCAEYKRQTGYNAECYDSEISNGITVKKL